MTKLKVGENILSTELLAYCQSFNFRWVIITDSHIEKIWGDKLANWLNIELITFPAGNKTRETKQHLEDILLMKGYGRDTGIIALGGGVVTDLIGFLASTYCRGVHVVYVPTTLLAMVDASIGGKTGVDTPYGKNLIGSFYPPHAVFMDISTLATLPEKEWCDGMVETIKHALILDAAFWDVLKETKQNIEHVINRSIEIKQKIVEQDQYDQGIRQLLNFGHTIGHAIETIEDYQVSHGEAVAIGILVEAYLSILSGFLNITALNEIEAMFQRYSISLKTNAFSDIAHFKKMMSLDKKAKHNIPHFILLNAIGSTARTDNAEYTFSIDSELLDKALSWGHQRFKY